jgi:hypothetical protein
MTWWTSSLSWWRRAANKAPIPTYIAVMPRYYCILLLLFSVSCADPNESIDVDENPLELTSPTPDFPANDARYAMLSYSEVGTRKAYSLKNDALTTAVDLWLIEHREIDLDDAIEFALDFTSDHLNFSTDKCANDPNKLAEDPNANCIGYSAFFNSVMTYVLKQKGWDESYKAGHLIGKINVLGTDVHQFFDNPFFKDHDFNKVVDRSTGAALYVDPSLYDYLGVVYVQVEK